MYLGGGGGEGIGCLAIYYNAIYATKIFIPLQLFDVTHQDEDGSSILKTCMYYGYIEY
jgi:hypothetical protein